MLRIVTLVVLIVVFGAQKSFADAIRVTAGTFVETATGVGEFSITSDSFSLSGTTTRSSGLLHECLTCEAGTTPKLKSWWEFEGTAEFEGTTYDATGRLKFLGPPAGSPALGALDGTRFTQAVLFIGRLNPTDASAPALRLIGNGLANVTFFRGQGAGTPPGLIRVDFEAAQTPEPTTLLLVGSGLAGAFAARRRIRKA